MRLQSKTVRMFLWISVILTAVMIYIFSAQVGESSLGMSGRIVEQLTRLTYPQFETLSPDRQETIYHIYQMVVRKTAHFSEYALLSFLLYFLFQSYDRQSTASLGAWGISTCYGALDEIHQLFTPDRLGIWQDVCIDSLGSLAGMLIAAGIFLLWRRKHEHL